MDALVDGALEWSPLQASDLPGLCELRTAIDYVDEPVNQVDPESLLLRHAEALEDPALDAVVGRDRGGTIVAYAWNVVSAPPGVMPEVWLDGGVHPAERNHHIGTHLLQWQLARVEEWAQSRVGDGPLQVWVGNHVDERVASRSHLMRRCGLAPERWFLDLRCDLDPLAEAARELPQLVDTDMGPVRIEPFDLERDADEVRALHNDIFVRLGARAVGVPEWRASLQTPLFGQVRSWVARAGDDIVGYALNSASGSLADPLREGWTDRFGVEHSWRGHGIGTALLLASRRDFARAGLTGAGAGIDTRDPELTLGVFLDAGYQPCETVALWSRMLEAEVDGTLRWEAPGHLG